MKIEAINVFGTVFTNLDIDSISVDIVAKRALCNVVFSAEDGARLAKQIIVEGDDYAQWGKDDNYIVDKLLGKSAATIDVVATAELAAERERLAKEAEAAAIARS